MSIENITLFSELHAEPSWLLDLRKKAFDKIDQLELPAIERVNSIVGILGTGRSQKARLLPMFQILQPLIQI